VQDADVIIIGSGMGGATMAAQLAPSGRKILIIERGDHLRPSANDRDDTAIFANGHFRPDETWVDGDGQPFNPGNYYNVGGNSKFYGAVLIRYRKEDFSELAHLQGSSPAWPITYDEIEPWYARAESMFQVRGENQGDRTEPVHSNTYDFPPVPDEADIADLRHRLARVGLTPVSLPLGVDVERWLAHGATPWDAFPDTCSGKMDAESIALQSAMNAANVSLMTNTKVERLEVDDVGTVSGVVVKLKDRIETLRAPIVVLAAGAVNSAALLLSSRTETYPTGLANRSDQVGRNFMNHNASAVLAMHPFRKNNAIYQKTLMCNDYYLTDGDKGPPLGNIQLLGKISGTILSANTPLPKIVANWIAARSFDFYAMSEDLPDPESRVTVKNEQIHLSWKRTNWDAHQMLVQKLKRVLKKAGFPIVLTQSFDKRTPSHQCGTARMGVDPTTSVVDTYCRSHDHKNLFIADASVLPTSAAVNPALTIAALSMRAADHILREEFAA